MAVSVFPPATGGGGGGSAPLPGAVDKIVAGKFKVFAQVETLLPAGSYVGTVLASTSGADKVDVKGSTTGNTSTLKAGVTTITTVTEQEDGLSFFATPSELKMQPVSGASENNFYNEDFSSAKALTNNTTLRFSWKSGAFTYATVSSYIQHLTGGQSVGWLVYRSSDGKDWQHYGTLSATRANESTWRMLSYPVTTGGVTRISHGPTYRSGSYYPIYYSTDNGSTWSSQTSNQSSYFYNQTQGPTLVWEYGGEFFVYSSEDPNDSFKTSNLATGSQASIANAIPSVNIGTPINYFKLGNIDAIVGINGIAHTTDNWATVIIRNWSAVSGNAFETIRSADFGGSYFAVSTNVGGRISYSTDLLAWTQFNIPNMTSLIYSINYSPSNNKWIVSQGDAISLFHNSSSNPTTGWFQSGGNGVGWGGGYILKDGYDGFWGYAGPTTNVYKINNSNNTMQQFGNSFRSMYQYSVARNAAGNVWLMGGFPNSAGTSNDGMIIRSTNGTTFTEVTTPLGAGAGYIVHLTWDAANSQFIAVTQKGNYATTPDGLTWTLGGNIGATSAVTLGSKSMQNYGSNLYIPINGATNHYAIASAPDYLNPVPIVTGAESNATRLCYVYEQDGLVYAATGGGAIYQQTSTVPDFTKLSTSIGLSMQTSPQSGYALPMQKVNNVWFAFGINQGLSRSSDGINWTVTDATSKIKSIDYDLPNNRYIGVGANLVAFSYDGITWVENTKNQGQTGGNAAIASATGIGWVTHDGSEFATVSQYLSTTEEFGVLYYSSDLQDL